MFATTTEGQRRVLSAARSLVKRRGYALVSLRAIAREAGYSAAGLYSHFPGRDAILAALADTVRTDLLKRLERAMGAAAGPEAGLVALGSAYVEFALAHPAEFELLFRHARSRKRGPDDANSSAFDLLRRAARAAAPPAKDREIDRTCLALWSCAHGLAMLRASHLADVAGDWDAWTRDVLRAQVEGLRCATP